MFWGQQASADGTVRPNAPVYLGLERVDVLLAQRPRVAEIEAQSVGRDERPLLGDMFSKPPPQRLVKQMRDRVIAAQQPTARAVGPELDGVAHLQAAVGYGAEMNVQVAR